jgi:hypothetical protein
MGIERFSSIGDVSTTPGLVAVLLFEVASALLKAAGRVFTDTGV